MIGVGEIGASLFGAFRLALLDEGGMAFFNTTREGFWRSFFAAVVCAPGYIALALLRGPVAAGLSLHDVLVGIFIYVIGWAAFPLAMAYLVQPLACAGRYVDYIVAYNWANVAQVLLFLVVAVLSRSFGLGDSTEGAVGILTALVVLGYFWFIARTALGIGAGKAAAVVGIDLLLTVVIHMLADALTASA